MTTTNLSLSNIGVFYIKNEIANGRYGSTSDVIRDALPAMGEHKTKLEAIGNPTFLLAI